MTIGVEPRVVTVEGAAKLMRAGMFAGDELIGLTEEGHALYSTPFGRVSLRPGGIRPEGVDPYRFVTRQHEEPEVRPAR
jgi:hypothetical protein